MAPPRSEHGQLYHTTQPIIHKRATASLEQAGSDVVNALPIRPPSPFVMVLSWISIVPPDWLNRPIAKMAPASSSLSYHGCAIPAQVATRHLHCCLL